MGAMARLRTDAGEDWAGVGFTREQLTDELTTAISAYLAARRPS